MQGVFRRGAVGIFLCRTGILCIVLLFFASCGSNSVNSSGAAQQEFVFPDVGVSDLSTLDPALGVDQNSTVVIQMLYSGLVRADRNGQPLPDQASWSISADQMTYTFMLKAGISFSDGTPVSAQSYVAAWTRALSPELVSPLALSLERPIVGAEAVAVGESQSLAGVRALNARTLQVSLTHPTASFLTALTNPLFFPVNQALVQQYGQQKWSLHAVGHAVGTGPFIVTSWQHNQNMVLAPNPRYYGQKTRIHAVNVHFVTDPTTAYYSYSAGLYDLVWGLKAADQLAVKGTAGFTAVPLWRTNALFFNPNVAPFNKLAVRQAFAQAIDKHVLTSSVLNAGSVSATTLIAPALPDYQSKDVGLAFNATKARTLLHTAYPDWDALAAFIFSYPISQVSQAEALALQAQWQKTLGIVVTLRPLEAGAYEQELRQHRIDFGFVACAPEYADASACLENLTSMSDLNAGQWNNAEFDQLMTQAASANSSERQVLYDQAEQLALADVSEFPLDNPVFAAVIPPWLHGVTLNGAGFYFGDWSSVFLSVH